MAGRRPSDVTAPELSRRSVLLAGGGLAGLAVVGVGGCSRQAADTRVSFLNWQDYVDPTLLTDFTAATGLAVGYETYESNDALAARLTAADVARRGGRRATSFDLIVPSTNLFRRLRRGESLQALDPEVVTESLLDNLMPEFRSLDADPGNRYAVPWGTGTTGIGYDTTVFSAPPSWEVFADATHKGRMSLLRERREAFAVALITDGASPNTRSKAEIDAAAVRLREFAANSAFNSATYLDDLAEGRLVAAHGFSTDVLQARKRNPNLAFTVPAQGSTRWVDLLCIPAGAPNPEGANRMVAFYLDPKISAANAVFNLVSTGNGAATEFVSADVLADPAVYPTAEQLANLAFLEDLGDAEDLYETAWESVLA